MSLSDKIRDLLGRRPLLCQDVNRFLADYLDGVLDERTRTQFEAHLRNCPNCDVYLDQYRKTIELVGDADRPEPPDELVERTVAFLRQHLADKP